MRSVLLVALLAAAPLAAQAPLAGSHQVTGRLSYDGKATLGGFTGTTDSVVGTLNPATELARASGYVAARSATLRTGNGKRDRDQWSSLEVDSFPYIRYDLDSVSVGTRAGDSVVVTLRGSFEIHGVKLRADLPARLWLDARTARLQADTPLDLRDYRIGGLTKFFGALKMDPHIVVHIDVTFLLGAG